MKATMKLQYEVFTEATHFTDKFHKGDQTKFRKTLKQAFKIQ